MEVSVRPITVTEELRRLPTRLNTIALNRMLAPYPMVRGEYTRWAERHTRQQQYAKVHKGQGYRPKRKDQMTQLEFDTAVVTLERNGRGSIKTNCEERVFVAACQVMLRRHNMPDSWGGPSDHELAEFLGGSDRRQRRLLKQIAEGLIKETGAIPPTPSTRH